MPLVEIVHAPHVGDPTLRRLRSVLPHLVSEAVECPEEPYAGDLQPGDVELRFRPLGPLDDSGLDLVVEVRSKWFESRAVNRQERTDRLHEGIAEEVEDLDVGVCLSLPVAAWSQDD